MNLLADANVGLGTIKSVSGHSSIKTTEEFYLRSRDDDVEQAGLATSQTVGEILAHNWHTFGTHAEKGVESNKGLAA